MESLDESLALGVPQGSVWLSTIFNNCMKLLHEIIRRFGLQYQQYADDK